jgi:hypothetical protein
MASFSFNAATVQPKTSFEPVPAGWYIAQITDSSVNPSKSGRGMRMSLTFDIIDGEFKNRKIFAGLNVQHENPDTENWAQKDLSAICHSVGVIDLKDTAQLHMKPLMIKLTVRDAQGGYEASNDVKGYKAAASGAAPAAGAPSAGNAALPPWQKKAA